MVVQRGYQQPCVWGILTLSGLHLRCSVHVIDDSSLGFCVYVIYMLIHGLTRSS